MNYVSAARRRIALAIGLDSTDSAGKPASPLFKIPFTDTEWAVHQYAREAADTLLHIRRWRITITPGDSVARQFFLNGELRDVTDRARLIFPNHSYLLLIEPAQQRVGPEEFDRRLSTSHQNITLENDQ